MKISKQISKIGLAVLSVLLIGYRTVSFCHESRQRPDVEAYNELAGREYQQLRERLMRMLLAAQRNQLWELATVVQRLLAHLDANPNDTVYVAQGLGRLNEKSD